MIASPNQSRTREAESTLRRDAAGLISVSGLDVGIGGALMASCGPIVTISGGPAMAAPAGFSSQGLAIGIQIVAPIRKELARLQLAYAYELAANWTSMHLPPLLKPS